MENQTKETLPRQETLEAEKMTGYDVLDKNDHDVGNVTAIWTDYTGRPAYIGVRTFWLVGRTHIVPGYTAEVNHPRKHIRIPFADEDVKNAPTFDPDADLGVEDERRILDYYRTRGSGLPEFQPEGQAPVFIKRETVEERMEPEPGAEAPSRLTAQEKTEEEIKAGERMEAERHAEAPPRETTQAQEASIPLHEEELKVGTRRVEAGGVRLHKVVRTETVQQPVNLKREEIEVERVPAGESRIKEGEKAFESEDIYIPLYREEPVSEKTARVTGEVRARKLEQTEQQTVSGEVRKEDVEVEKQKKD